MIVWTFLKKTLFLHRNNKLIPYKTTFMLPLFSYFSGTLIIHTLLVVSLYIFFSQDSFDPKLPSVIFGTISLISGFLTLFLPETLGKTMPQTLEEGESLGLGDRRRCFGSSIQQNERASVASDTVWDTSVYTYPRPISLGKAESLQ